MDANRFSQKFVASQIAGSCRLDGVRVSIEDEQLICDIISGKVEPQELRRALVNQYKQRNRNNQPS